MSGAGIKALGGFVTSAIKPLIGSLVMALMLVGPGRVERNRKLKLSMIGKVNYSPSLSQYHSLLFDFYTIQYI